MIVLPSNEKANLKKKIVFELCTLSLFAVLKSLVYAYDLKSTSAKTSVKVLWKIVSHKTSKSDKNFLLRFSQNVDKQTYTHSLHCEGKHSLWFKKCALLKENSATQPNRLPAQNTFGQSQTPKSVVNNFSVVDRILGQHVCHVITPPAIFKPAIKILTAVIMLGDDLEFSRWVGFSENISEIWSAFYVDQFNFSKRSQNTI